MSLLRKMYMVCILCVWYAPVYAISVNGMHTVNFTPPFLSSMPPEEVVQQARQTAILSAWKNYTSTFSTARMRVYLQHKADIDSNLKTYINSVILVNKDVDKRNRKLTVTVKVDFNESVLDLKFNSFAAIANAGMGDGSYIVFLFAVRQVQSQQQFNVKKTDIAQSQIAKESSESNTQNSDSLNQQSFSMTTSGGSTVKKADKVEYKLVNDSISADDIDTAMSEVLADYGYEVTGYDDVVSECGGVERADIEQEIINNNAVSRASRKSAINGARECEVKYFSTGTLDVGVGDIDPVTGSNRITVALRAGIDNISRRLPKKVATIGPIQATGLGDTEQSAIRNALRQVAQQASKALVDKLNAKNVR